MSRIYIYTMKYQLLLAVLITATYCDAQTPVDREEEIFIGGIRQFIAIQSADTTLPLMLFLHGGPGGSMLSYSERFTDRLRAHFVVVQWDQRETGRTLELNSSPVDLTLAVFQRDTEELIQYLLARYKRQKLYLVGHSWGTVLGFHIARSHPELLYAFIPIGPMINQLESERMALSMMREKSFADSTAVGELAKVKVPFQSAEQLFYHRKWLKYLTGNRRSLSKSHVESWAATWLPVFNEASQINLIESLPEIACPVFFFVGRKDFQTSSYITAQYYSIVKAPKKDLFWFETGHAIPASAPSRMQDIIIDKILPETFIIQKPAPLISTQ